MPFVEMSRDMSFRLTKTKERDTLKIGSFLEENAHFQTLIRRVFDVSPRRCGRLYEDQTHDEPWTSGSRHRTGISGGILHLRSRQILDCRASRFRQHHLPYPTRKEPPDCSRRSSIACRQLVGKAIHAKPFPHASLNASDSQSDTIKKRRVNSRGVFSLFDWKDRTTICLRSGPASSCIRSPCGQGCP